MTSHVRRAEINRVRLHGRTARDDGKPVSSVPSAYRNNMNAMHWRDGWNERDAELIAASTSTQEEAEVRMFVLMPLERRNEYLVRKIFNLEQEIAALKERR